MSFDGFDTATQEKEADMKLGKDKEFSVGGEQEETPPRKRVRPK